MNIESFSDQFKDVKIASGINFQDQRGTLKKTMYGDKLEEIINPIKEVITSTSKKNVIRGLHYQKKPGQIKKFVTCSYGEILDTFVNINPNSSNFKKYGQIKLKSEDSIALLVPEDYAHGYSVLSDFAIVTYIQSGNYDPELDAGYSPFSLNIDWTVDNPIVSEKDQSLELLN